MRLEQQIGKFPSETDGFSHLEPRPPLKIWLRCKLTYLRRQPQRALERNPTRINDKEKHNGDSDSHN